MLVGHAAEATGLLFADVPGLPCCAAPCCVQELARAKDAAVAAEDYDEAKRLKAAIERLKVCATHAAGCGALQKELTRMRTMRRGRA